MAEDESKKADGSETPADEEDVILLTEELLEDDDDIIMLTDLAEEVDAELTPAPVAEPEEDDAEIIDLSDVITEEEELEPLESLSEADLLQQAEPMPPADPEQASERTETIESDSAELDDDFLDTLGVDLSEEEAKQDPFEALDELSSDTASELEFDELMSTAAAAAAKVPELEKDADAGLAPEDETEEPIDRIAEMVSSDDDAPEVSSEQIDAALERVIAKLYGEKIESILVETVEKKVAAEIALLKRRLLEEE